MSENYCLDESLGNCYHQHMFLACEKGISLVVRLNSILKLKVERREGELVVERVTDSVF